MSWASARDLGLVPIITGTVPEMKKKGLPAKFTYNSEASRAELPGDSRTCFFEIETIAMKGQITVGLPRWQRAKLHALFFYELMTDVGTLLEAIADDHLELVTRFGDASKWNQPASTIESLVLGSELLGESKLISVPNGLLLDIAFEMEWNNV